MERRSILLAEPIKEIGEYKVPIRLYKDVEPEITVKVVAEEKEKILMTIKKIQELSKSFEGFTARCGLVEGKIIGADEIKNLASLPGKDVLYAQIVSLIKSPITNIVFILKAPMQYLISVLNQIKEKKS